MLSEQCALASQEVWQVLWLYQIQQVLLVAATLDGDLLSGLLIEESLDDTPDAREEHGCVHDKGLPHDLRVVVTAHAGCQLDQAVHLLGEDLHGAAVEVEDVQALLNALAGDGRARGEPQTHQQLVRGDVMLDQTLLCGQLEDLVNLEEAEALDVDGSALLIGLVVEVRVDGLDLVELLELKVLHNHGGLD